MEFEPPSTILFPAAFHANMSLSTAAAQALSQMLEPDAKSMLNAISGRLNEIDLKLSLILDLLNKQQNSGLMDCAPAVSVAESLIPAVNTSQSLANQLVAAVNSASLLNSPPPTSIFNDPTLASRLLAACQERPDLQSALSALSGQMPKLEPKLEPDTNALIWAAVNNSAQTSPTDQSELMAAMMAAANASHAIMHQTIPSPSTHQPPEDRQKIAGSADSKAFSDDVVDENEEDEEFDFEDEGDSPTATTSKQSAQSELSPPATDVESSFPEGAVKRAAEKAARSFQSTQPKVFAWQILRESITDDELKNIQISLRTFHGETAAHLLSRQLPKIRLVVEMTMRYFKWDALADEAQLAKAKLLLSHLKNNAKVRNWTLREGRPNRSRRSEFGDKGRDKEGCRHGRNTKWRHVVEAICRPSRTQWTGVSRHFANCDRNCSTLNAKDSRRQQYFSVTTKEFQTRIFIYRVHNYSIRTSNISCDPPLSLPFSFSVITRTVIPFFKCKFLLCLPDLKCLLIPNIFALPPLNLSKQPQVLNRCNI
uniref:Uncharacterized protein n=2 Tax=Panagrolaimus sp. JU765 TaxID=591449 RepID=A0AC34RK57_9BILA